MTDPISVTASIIGITAAGIKLSRELYTICDTIGSSQAQIEDLACDLASFTSIVNELEAIFKSPKPIHSDALKKSLSDVLDKCRSLFQKINRMIGRTESEGESTVRLKTRVAWVFRETKVRPIRASLESTKQTLGLMLHTLKFAADE
ncbi:uncharacterized protein K441DRAFT_54564 [Cenococcum geophilum 1.58]|uniref:uncharacterized protein n=1 Tax=Cenococcum geophilum 1.58 TaxID=794803 RepID=UPI0035900FCB|nr:hypothetical protein K441DRAFT_54564 [Cenococcum geophilum 1.58]